MPLSISTSVSPVALPERKALDDVGVVSYWEFDDVPDSPKFVDSKGSNDFNNPGIRREAGLISYCVSSTQLRTPVPVIADSTVGLTLADTFTFVLWVYPAIIGGVASYIIEYKSSNDEHDSYDVCYTSTSTTFRVLCKNDGVDKSILNLVGLSDAWHMFVITNNMAKKEVGLSVDGESLITVPIAALNPSAGSEFAILNTTLGMADQARHYNKVISDAEILWLYNDGKGRRGTETYSE